MRQEYLLLNEAERDSLKEYKPKGISVEEHQIDSVKYWRVSFCRKGENEETAKLLSSVHKYVVENFNVSVLENGSSAYFNKKLYPLVNDFERRLRKLLYITRAIYTGDDINTIRTISDLETKDFGNIFSALFVDDSFMNSVKTEIKSRNRDNFTKDSIIELIGSLEEKTIWDALLGKDTVPTLRSNFDSVRRYRNDVMHSHDILWSEYQDISKLYSKINSELSNAIGSIIGEDRSTSPESEHDEIPQKDMEGLWDRLSELASYAPSPEVIQSAMDAMDMLSKIPKEVLDGQNQITRIMNTTQPNDWAYLMCANEIMNSSKVQEAMRQIQQFQRVKVDIPPTIMELQALTEKLSLEHVSVPPELLRTHEMLSRLVQDTKMTEGTTGAGSTTGGK